MFRIAVGSCSCAGFEESDGIKKLACEQLTSKIQHLRQLSFAQLSSLSQVETSEVVAEGKKILFATQIERRGQDLLVVVQAFHPTWKFPTYISKGGVGKKFVEGFIASPDNKKVDAPSEWLWEYR